MQAYEFFFSYLFNAFGNEEGISKVLSKARQEIDPEIYDLPQTWFQAVSTFLEKEPYSLWNQDVANTAFSQLESYYSKIDNIDSLIPAIQYFFSALSAYHDIAEATVEIGKVMESSEIMSRLYRLPVYTLVLESCITQLYKFFAAHLNLIVQEDLSSQVKLGSLVNLMNKHGLADFCIGVDVDIRNSISHGTYFILHKEVIFYFSEKGRRGSSSKKIQDYTFDKLINQAIDTASGILLGTIRFFVRHSDIYHSYFNKFREIDFTSISAMKLLLTTQKARCSYIETSEYERPQIEIRFNVDFKQKSELMSLAIFTALAINSQFPRYLDYFIGFDGNNLLSSFIRFRKEEIEKYVSGEITLEELARTPIDNDRLLIWDFHEPSEDVARYKYFRYRPIEGNGWRVRSISDASTQEKKRFRAELYVGETTDRSEIKRMVGEAINAVRVLFNPPRENNATKNGDMDADAVYMNVYRKYHRYSKKELFSSNLNFVLVANYNARNMKPLPNGGLPEKIWAALDKEKHNDVLLAWNPTVYRQLR